MIIFNLSSKSYKEQEVCSKYMDILYKNLEVYIFFSLTFFFKTKKII